jgi:hypothetical protein
MKRVNGWRSEYAPGVDPNGIFGKFARTFHCHTPVP